MTQANTQELHVIFGAGPVGTAIMTELNKLGKSIRIVNRSGGNFPEGVENIRGDVLTDHGFAVKASEGATHIYFALNPQYTEWLKYFAPMQEAVLNAAIVHGAKLIAMENVYMYGDTAGKPMTEGLPYNAHTRKGALRARMSKQLLQAHTDGKVRVTMGRASDFYGPGVTDSAMGERTFVPALSGKPAEYMGDPNTLHTQSYMADIGRGLVTLALDERADGRAWHLPNAHAITQAQFIEKIFAETGHETKTKPLPNWMLTFLSPFVPILRELKEMQYEFQSDFIVDSSDFEKTFGWQATPYDEGIKETVKWYQQHHSAS